MNPGVEISACQPVELIDELIKWPQGNPSGQQGKQDANKGAGYREQQEYGAGFRASADGFDDAEPNHEVHEQAGKDSGNGYNDKYKQGDQYGESKAPSALFFFHTFFTALYPRPRTDFISNSSHPSKRRRSLPTWTVTVSQPVSLSEPHISSMSWMRVKICPG